VIEMRIVVARLTCAVMEEGDTYQRFRGLDFPSNSPR